MHIISKLRSINKFSITSALFLIEQTLSVAALIFDKFGILYSAEDVFILEMVGEGQGWLMMRCEDAWDWCMLVVGFMKVGDII